MLRDEKALEYATIFSKTLPYQYFTGQGKQEGLCAIAEPPAMHIISGSLFHPTDGPYKSSYFCARTALHPTGHGNMTVARWLNFMGNRELSGQINP